MTGLKPPFLAKEALLRGTARARLLQQCSPPTAQGEGEEEAAAAAENATWRESYNAAQVTKGSPCADEEEDDDACCVDEMWVLAIASKGQEGRRRRGLAAGAWGCNVLRDNSLLHAAQQDGAQARVWYGEW